MNNIIKVRGARTGGLKEVDMDLPLGSVICFTGRSSSGRRAMALEVLFAESRRRYMQALAPAERGNSSGVAQVDVDEIAGLPPAISFAVTSWTTGLWTESLNQAVPGVMAGIRFGCFHRRNGVPYRDGRCRKAMIGAGPAATR